MNVFLRFIVDHPYIFGLTLIALGMWGLVYGLWWRAMGTDYTATIDEDAPWR